MRNQNTKSMIVIALMTSVICILGPITIALPFSPVPISFTTLALSYVAIILGRKNGTLSCILYLLLGLAGIPVFSNFSAGPGKLFGPTGGYLIGFIFMVYIAGFFVDRYPNRISLYVLGLILGTLVTYGLGTLWLAYQANLSFTAAVFAGVIPYIPGDLIKIILATLHGPIIKRRLKQAGYLS